MAGNIRYCRKCGYAMTREAKFCKNCGNPVSTKADTSASNAATSAVNSAAAGEEMLSKIVSTMKDMNFKASSVKGEMELPMTDVQGMFMKYIKKFLIVFLCAASVLFAMPVQTYADESRLYKVDTDPENLEDLSNGNNSDFTQRYSGWGSSAPLSTYWSDCGLQYVGMDNPVTEFRGQPMWIMDNIYISGHPVNLETGIKKYGSDKPWNMQLVSEESNPQGTYLDLVYRADCEVGDIIQVAGFNWNIVTAYALGTVTDWELDYSINSDYWKDEYNSEYTERSIINSNVREVCYEGEWEDDANDYIYADGSCQSHVSTWEYEVEEGDDAVVADVDIKQIFEYKDSDDGPTQEGNLEVRMRVIFYVDGANGNAVASNVDDSNEDYMPPEEPEEQPEDNSWVYNTDAESQEDTESDLPLPKIAIGVLTGAALIGIGKKISKGSKKKKNQPMGNKKAAKVAQKEAQRAAQEPAKEKPEEKKEDQKKEEKEDPFTYSMRVYKEFGDTLRPGPDSETVYARIVRTDPKGNTATDDRLTNMINISSPEYLKVHGQKRSGEYMAALVNAPMIKGGEVPEEAVVEFTMSANGARLSNRVHFKVANGAIEFVQENLGLPAHYEEEVRLMFCVFNMPEDVEVTAKIFGTERKNPYEVEIEPNDEYPNAYYAVIRDILSDDVHDPGYTQYWTLHIDAESPSGSVRTETDFSIYRIFMGMSFTMEADAIGCYFEKEYDPAYTEGHLMIFAWDEENMEIVRVAPTIRKDSVKTTALSVENDRIASKGEANESHQKIVDSLGIIAVPLEQPDIDCSRVIRLTTSTASLDRPTRLRARVTITCEYENKEYTASREVLLHSMPFREVTPEVLKKDEHISEQLASVKARISYTYMEHLFSLYNLIDRMLDGYDERFGYDQNQYLNVMKIWIDFLHGDFAGANGEAEGVTLADELSSYYAFLEGMRDNGGILGRIALGVCTAGYSEHVFFAMDLYEKMEVAVMSCKDDKDFGFWDGVTLGVKEYEKNLIMEFAMGGALKAGNSAIGHMTGIDVAKTINKNVKASLDAAEDALRKNSKTYAAVGDGLAKVQGFLNGSAKSLSNAREASAQARNAANERIDARVRKDLKDVSFAQRRNGAVDVVDPSGNHSIAMDELRELKKLQGEVRRGQPDYWDKKAAYEKKCLEIMKDPHAKELMKEIPGSDGYTIRAEYNKFKHGFHERVQNTALDLISEDTGILRDSLYTQNVSSNKLADELAGKTSSVDLDVTAAEEVVSDRSKDIVIGQTTGSINLAKATYKNVYGRLPANEKELAEAIELAMELDITYVSPGGDYGYVIEHNAEAYYDLPGMLDKSQYNRALKGKTMNQKTIYHKASEWYKRGDKFSEQAQVLESEIKSTKLSETDLLIKNKEIKRLKYKADGCYGEGTRQVSKTVDGIADIRNDYAVSRGENNLFTDEIRDLQNLCTRVNSNEGKISVDKFVSILKEDYGLDLYSFADKMSKVFQ